MNDIGIEGFKIVENMINAFQRYNLPTKIMASSIRNKTDVDKIIELGIDAITVSPKIFTQLFEHKLITIGVEQFRRNNSLVNTVVY